jgi:hypothetical protein
MPSADGRGDGITNVTLVMAHPNGGLETEISGVWFVVVPPAGKEQP